AAAAGAAGSHVHNSGIDTTATVRPVSGIDLRIGSSAIVRERGVRIVRTARGRHQQGERDGSVGYALHRLLLTSCLQTSAKLRAFLPESWPAGCDDSALRKLHR